MKFRSTDVKSPRELEEEKRVLEARNLQEASDEAERLELAQSSSQTSQLVNRKQSPRNSLSPSRGQTTQYLGTDHFKNLNQSLQDLIPALDEFLSHATLETAHVPHLGSVERNAKSLSRRTIRLARLVGRLYGSQGWDLKYSHAVNTALERKLKARGGYDALRQAQRMRDEGQ